MIRMNVQLDNEIFVFMQDVARDCSKKLRYLGVFVLIFDSLPHRPKFRFTRTMSSNGCPSPISI